MNLALEPGSEYERAIGVFEHEGIYGIHAFAESASAYLWDVMPGPVNVHVAHDRAVLVLAQVEFAEDDAGAARAYAHARSAGGSRAGANALYESGGELRHRITGGPAVVAWSPNSAQDLQEPIGLVSTANGAADRLLDLATRGSGALVRLEPGSYASSLHYHEDRQEKWAVSWCVVRRT